MGSHAVLVTTSLLMIALLTQELMAGAGWRPGAPGHDGLLPPTSPGGMQPQLSIPYLMQHARLCARGLSPGAQPVWAPHRRCTIVLLQTSRSKATT